MPTLNVWVTPPDDWEEFVISNENGVSHRLSVAGKVAPFRTSVRPEQPGQDAIQVDLVSTQQQQSPHIGINRHDGAYASVPVDFSALTWMKEQWARGRRIELSLHGDNVAGFTLGSSPDGDDVVWNQDIATHVKLSQAVLSVSAYKEGTEMQATEAPTPEAPVHPDLKASLTKITSRLDLLLGMVVIFAVYYWVQK
jgi:hypothetical protein